MQHLIIRAARHGGAARGSAKMRIMRYGKGTLRDVCLRAARSAMSVRRCHAENEARSRRRRRHTQAQMPAPTRAQNMRDDDDALSPAHVTQARTRDMRTERRSRFFIRYAADYAAW